MSGNGELAWRCDRCGRPASVLTVDALRAIRALHRYERETRAVRDRHRDPETGIAIVPLSELPDLAREPWAVGCDACLTKPEAARGYYWIAVEQIADTAAALDWTLHLSQKRWLEATTWPDLMRGSSCTDQARTPDDRSNGGADPPRRGSSSMSRRSAANKEKR